MSLWCGTKEDRLIGADSHSGSMQERIGKEVVGGGGAKFSIFGCCLIFPYFFCLASLQPHFAQHIISIPMQTETRNLSFWSWLYIF